MKEKNTICKLLEEKNQFIRSLYYHYDIVYTSKQDIG